MRLQEWTQRNDRALLHAGNDDDCPALTAGGAIGDERLAPRSLPAPARRAPGGTRWPTCLLIGLALATSSAPALSQGRLDSDSLKAFGGSYSVSCGDNASPKATVFADALVFLHGSKRIAGRDVQAAASYLGPNMPPEYRTVLLSEVDGRQLMFVLYEDRSGYYLTVDGDAQVVAKIGKPLAGRKFRRCDGAPQTVRAAPAPQRRYAMHELSAAGLVQDPTAKAAYYKALGPLVREPWLASLDGPSPQNKPLKLAHTEFILASACKNHDCADYNTVLLYSAAENVVYGKVFQRGRSTLIGAPPPAVATALEKLWKAEWRRNR